MKSLSFQDGLHYASMDAIDTIQIGNSFQHSVVIDFPQRSYVMTWINPEENSISSDPLKDRQSKTVEIPASMQKV
jgi:hypothetical protein